jgi:glycosyltransferase involved in cell wall biosynthesis
MEFDMSLYGSLAGFKYYIKTKPLLGAYVAMENFANGLLKYGKFDEYHTYYDQQEISSFSNGETINAFFRNDKLKVMRLEDLISNPKVQYKVLHFETIIPYQEIVFRNMFSKKNIPVTRRAYTISTNAHLREFLNIQLLGNGGRPYDSIVVPSRATREVLLSYFDDLSETTAGKLSYKGRVDVIPYGIHIDEFQPENKRFAREMLGLPPNGIIILSVARISQASKMNYSRLLEFFARLSNEYDDTELLLLIAGAASDDEMQELYQLVEKMAVDDKIRIISNFDDSLKMRILSSADIFISLSDNLQESFGIAVIEAMAMGLPVICTDWDGYKDIVDDGVTGYRIQTIWEAVKFSDDILINFRNPYDHSVIYRVSQDIYINMDLLITRALGLIYNEKLRSTMGQNGRKKVGKTYSISTEISQFENLWDELARMAEMDCNKYQDLSSVLNYNYPKHFKSFPSKMIDSKSTLE